MKLLTQAIKKKLPRLYAQDGKEGEAIVHVKYFTPDAQWTWLVHEGEPVKDENDQVIDYVFFGLVIGHEKEFGYFHLSELEKVRGSLGLPVERDLYFKPKPIYEIAPELFVESQKKGGD
jgi:hypothetical protein